MSKDKKYRKIREYLGNDYHLYEEWDLNGKKWNWKLFEKYDGWISDNSSPIMTSNNYNYSDLYKFAKKRREYDENKILDIFFIMVAWITVGLSFSNAYFNSTFLKGFTYGIDLVIILSCIIKIIISSHNLKVARIKFRDRFVKWKD